MAITKRIIARMTNGLKTFRPIIEQQKTRDISEADTVTLVKDSLCEIMGYDKYTELTGETAIRGTYCDLMVKFDEKIQCIIEVKAIGISLEDRHVKQAVDYAANQGVEWVILTNAVEWRLYNIVFGKPIDKKLICEMILPSLDLKREADQEKLFTFTKEGFQKGFHVEAKQRHEATSRYILAALLLNNDIVQNIIRRELRRIVDVNVSSDDIARVLREDVIKRDTLEGPEAEKATQKVNRRGDRPLRSTHRSSSEKFVQSSSQTVTNISNPAKQPTARESK